MFWADDRSSDRYSYESAVIDDDGPVVVKSLPVHSKIGYDVVVDAGAKPFRRYLGIGGQAEHSSNVMLRVALSYGNAAAFFVKHWDVSLAKDGKYISDRLLSFNNELDSLSGKIRYLLESLSDSQRGEAFTKISAFADRFEAKLILSEMYASGSERAPVRTVAVLFRKILLLIEEGRFEVIDSLMKTAQITRLPPEVFVGILRTTGAVRLRLAERSSFYDKVQSELSRRGLSVQSIMTGISRE